MSRGKRVTIINTPVPKGWIHQIFSQGSGDPEEQVILHIGEVYQVQPWNPQKKNKLDPNGLYFIEGFRYFHTKLKARLRHVDDWDDEVGRSTWTRRI